MAGYREFQTGEVLTAANVNGFLMNQAVMVFADDAARTTALAGVLAEGMLTYNLDTQALEVYDGTDFVSVGGAVKERRIEAFTGDGTFTVPAGVTYAIAHMLGGGGAVTVATPPTLGSTDGGQSSVAFASGTVTSAGGVRTAVASNGSNRNALAGPANSGRGAMGSGDGSNATASNHGGSSQWVVAGAAVTPAASITVTVGAGGTGSGPGATANGGSGYVYIEFFEEV